MFLIFFYYLKIIAYTESKKDSSKSGIKFHKGTLNKALMIFLKMYTRSNDIVNTILLYRKKK